MKWLSFWRRAARHAWNETELRSIGAFFRTVILAIVALGLQYNLQVRDYLSTIKIAETLMVVYVGGTVLEYVVRVTKAPVALDLQLRDVLADAQKQIVIDSPLLAADFGPALSHEINGLFARGRVGTFVRMFVQIRNIGADSIVDHWQLLLKGPVANCVVGGLRDLYRGSQL